MLRDSSIAIYCTFFDIISPNGFIYFNFSITFDSIENYWPFTPNFLPRGIPRNLELP